MSFWWTSLGAIPITMLCASEALACDTSPDLVRIPGATEAEAERRYEAYERDTDIILAFEREKLAVEGSWKVYLAEIETVTEDPARKSVTAYRVKPVWQVRGLLPQELQTLEVPSGNVSCASRGSRPLRRVEPGALLIVFESPGSRHGMSAEDARSGELVDAISMYALQAAK